MLLASANCKLICKNSYKLGDVLATCLVMEAKNVFLDFSIDIPLLLHHFCCLPSTVESRTWIYLNLCHKRIVESRTQISLITQKGDTLFIMYAADEDESNWHRKKLDEEPAWSHNPPHVISQFAQCFTNAMVGPRAWIGGIFNRSSNKRLGSDKYLNYPLTPHQEQSLHGLQERLGVPFDEARLDHQEALRDLWNAAFPNVKLKSLISEQWKDMGWQGANPSTDFRGCGFISLENLLYFATRYPACFHRLLFKQSGLRATWEYPFAVAGINVTFMLIQMLDLFSEKPKCLPGLNFVKLIGEDDEAFDVLYCIAFAMMDAQWLAMRASYMEFNNVLQATRMQLERELSLDDIQRIEDLPAFNLI
ncbi:uncharacterized protein LOC107032561 isoform X4 [Solanum pennellii]|uniref:Uncharacterized protein LOC107032561 isoform X4 n=1 Tax=Solanum pennellii TaxID=28526 RepID=A0ABM1HSG0_SOLPN|nr:uncharacterized protein LOC107032561 isoform X4 [Solanum pennellii]